MSMIDYTDFPVFPSFAHEEGNPNCPCNECSFARLKACDWCGKESPIGEMEPEEAGEWICRECFDRDLHKFNQYLDPNQ